MSNSKEVVFSGDAVIVGRHHSIRIDKVVGTQKIRITIAREQTIHTVFEMWREDFVKVRDMFNEIEPPIVIISENEKANEEEQE